MQKYKFFMEKENNFDENERDNTKEKIHFFIGYGKKYEKMEIFYKIGIGEIIICGYNRVKRKNMHFFRYEGGIVWQH